jgi:UDP-glucose 4-epimerase
MTRSILLTGGLGYVGGRVAKGLAEDPEFDITITSRNPDTTVLPEWLSRDHCVRLDVLNDDDIKNACKNTDVIIHLAALNEIDSVLDPEKALLVNVLGTLKLVRAAEAAGVEKFIYFSTAHVYGSPLEGSISETTLPRPVHPYAITHRAAEDYVLATNHQKKMQGVVLRMSNSIGAPINSNVNRWSLAGNDLCRQAITTREMRLATSGIQKRDFIPLHDVARAVSHMIRLPVTPIEDNIFNLGGENVLSIYDLALRIQKRCIEIFNFNPSIIRKESQRSETSGSLSYSIKKLKSTGFVLTGNLDHEIDETLLFCQEHYSISQSR